MTAEHGLLIVFGLVAGFCVGYVTAWRFARKLEHHGVELAAWDQHFDAGAEPKRSANVLDIRGAK